MADDDVKIVTGEFFRLDLAGAEGDLMFKSCTLPSGSLTPADVQYINGQSKSEGTSIPVTMNWAPITVERAVDDKSSFWEWFKTGIPAEGGGTGNMEKKDCTLELIDGEGSSVKKWSLTGAYPISFAAGGTLNAGSGAILVESMQIGYDHCKIENG